MSEAIKHECGIAMIRLLKPLDYYAANYGSPLYGLNKLYLLMEKQHNRGQDGAGMATIKFDMKPGQRYINRVRSNSDSPIKDVFATIHKQLEKNTGNQPKLLNDINWLKNNIDYCGEVYLGHLRYGTFGKNNIDNCHPLLRENNWMTRNLVLAGNFNLTNVDELFETLVNIGQHPKETSDTVTVIERIGHFIDEENERLYKKFKNEGYSKREISPLIAENMDILQIIKNSSHKWDGGYVIAGMLGHGDSFVMRDPSGIRPAFYYKDDEVVVVASERPVIQTAMNVFIEDVHEVKPGHALIIRKNGDVKEVKFTESKENKACSFERIYFSRGTDADIYTERKKLGENLCPAILEKINYDFENTVFSYIPNTAEAAFLGMVQALERECNKIKKDKLLKLKDKVSEKEIEKILSIRPRVEKIAVKDAKLRTFITQDNARDDLVAHVYDTTYGVVRDKIDTLVILDDSIVRGTTLKQSILKILDRLNPKKIIIVSSAPQIRYPDCYGIDMAKLGDFVAFRAAIELLKQKNKGHIINEVYNKAKDQERLPKEEIVNHVKEIFKPFTDEEISAKIAELLTPKDLKADVNIIYQSVANLHDACPKNNGDWYFTGNYPTPGGNKVVNKSFINFIEGKNERAY